MSTTLPRPITPLLDAETAVDPRANRSGRRPLWPVFGIVAGVAGFVSGMTSITSVTDEQAQEGVGVIDHISRGTYHVAFVSGIIAFASLFVAASGWKRWAEQRAPRDLAARTIGTALAATATIIVIFAGLAGSMALYLPGGMDEGTLSNEGIFVNYTMLDFGLLLGWWGAAVAAVAVATLALRRTRVLPRWMGVVSILLLLMPVGTAVATGLPGLVGMFMPIWLVTISVGLLVSRTANA